MNTYWTLAQLVVIMALLLGCNQVSNSERMTGQVAGTTKKLIEFGWDEPGPTFMRDHCQEMDKTPFDGTVFHLDYVSEDGTTGNFTWECWGRRTFTAAELQPSLDALQAAHFTKLKHNFVRFNVCPGDVDWFDDDFKPVLKNARLASRIARASGCCDGILFDIEQYKTRLFDYGKQKHAGEYTWEQYAAQVRRRGRQLMNAFQVEWPGLTILLTFGYSLPWHQARGNPERLPEVSYGLLAPLLDGMYEAAGMNVKIVDGYELSYRYKTMEQFEQAYETMASKLLPIVAVGHRYAQHRSLGFGIWMDAEWRERGWHVDDFSKNYFTPQELETSVRSALQVTDEYVWIYSETPRWWSPSGPQKLPQEYFDAVMRARKAAGLK